MVKTVSPSEAAERFDELMTLVRSGQRVLIVERGREVAEIRPPKRFEASLEELLPWLEQQGLVSLPARPLHPISSITPKPGALSRFLRSRK